VSQLFLTYGIFIKTLQLAGHLIP